MKRKGEETKEKIIRHAVDLFYRHGYTKASTRMLVKSAGMTSSAIYNHFQNKDEILFTIIQQTADGVLLDLKRAIQQHKDPVECLKLMITDMLQSLTYPEMRKKIAILNDELYQLPRELREKCYERHREIFEVFRGIISEIQKRDRSEPINDTVATFGTLGAMLWIKNWYKDDGPLSIDEISDELVNFVLKGLTGCDDVP
jgi:AcrR family transcriptional regulator